MITIKKIEDVIEGARTETEIAFFVADNDPLEYVNGNIYVGFTDENDNWFVFKVTNRVRINNLGIIYKARFLGSRYDKSEVFDKIDIEETRFVNIIDEAIIETAKDRARCN